MDLGISISVSIIIYVPLCINQSVNGFLAQVFHPFRRPKCQMIFRAHFDVYVVLSLFESETLSIDFPRMYIR